jgi:hypothetical protein
MKIKEKTDKIYRLRVGKSGPCEPCAELIQVHHVSHLRDAIRILEDGKVTARRVNDQSRLDDRKVSVVWLAPNQWSEGSRYGTVQFTFDFAHLVEGKNIYWVEGVTGRKRDTCRLLIADSEKPRFGLKLYDPDKTKGPLRRIEGKWYWKKDLEFELMLEGDLPLTECLNVATVDHHHIHCGRGSVGKCADRRMDASAVAARVLAGALSGRYDLPGNSFTHAGRASSFLHSGWFGLVDTLSDDDDDFTGKARRKDRVDALVRAGLSLLSNGDVVGAAAAVSEIASFKRFRRSLKRLLERSAKIPMGSPYDTVIGPSSPMKQISPRRVRTSSRRRSTREPARRIATNERLDRTAS